MAIPTRSREEPYFFPTIALTIRSDNEIEWIGRFRDVIVWVRVNCEVHRDVSESAQIPIDAQTFLRDLKIFEKSTVIKNKIQFTHDPDQGLDFLTHTYSRSKSSREPAANLSEVRGMLESFPFRLDKEGSEIILFQNGLIKPNISGSCDVELFQDLVTNARKLKKLELESITDRSLKKKKKSMPLMYNIYFDDDSHIKTVAGHENLKYSIADRILSSNIHGRGELHYSSGFAEVVNVLSGQIKFYAIDNGPLWIMQDTDRMKLRYLIAPTPVYTF
jgi:hypothetical protein